jgi:hypothetical protein
LGYWISIAGVARATFLALIFPREFLSFLSLSNLNVSLVILKLFRPKPAIRLSTNEPSSGAHTMHVPSLDLAVSRVSLLVILAASVYQATGPSSTGFLGAAVLVACSSGFGPSVQSLAMELYRERGGKESGKLFGALSVLSSLTCVFSFSFLHKDIEFKMHIDHQLSDRRCMGLCL